MTRYIVRRLLVSLPVLFGIILIVFVTARILPGATCRILLGERATDLACGDFTPRYGFARPLVEQFISYLAGLPHGDLGASLRTSEPVTELLIQRLPVTLGLAPYSRPSA